MPTTIPRERRPPILFFVFMGALFITMVAIEVIDPAPMDVDAATIAAP